jgi:hypothetical protein
LGTLWPLSTLPAIGRNEVFQPLLDPGFIDQVVILDIVDIGKKRDMGMEFGSVCHS